MTENFSLPHAAKNENELTTHLIKASRLSVNSNLLFTFTWLINLCLFVRCHVIEEVNRKHSYFLRPLVISLRLLARLASIHAVNYETYSALIPAQLLYYNNCTIIKFEFCLRSFLLNYKSRYRASGASSHCIPLYGYT